MFAIIVTEKGGDQRRHEFDKSEVTIGRVQGNDVILPKGNVSKRHARIVLKDGKFIIVDLKSTNGTYVNGRKITSPLVVKENDKIYIGDFILGVEEVGGAAASVSEPDAPEAPAWGAQPPAPPRPIPRTTAPPPPAPPPPMAEPAPAPDPGPAPRATQQRPAINPPPALADESGTQPPQPPRPAPRPSGPPKPSRPRPRASEPPPAPGAMASPAPAPISSPAPAPLSSPGPVLPEPSPVPAPPAGQTLQPRPRLIGAGAPPPRAHRPTAATAASQRGVSFEPLDSKLVKMLELQAEIHDRLLAKLDLDAIPPEDLGDEELWQRAETSIVDLVETMDSSGDVPNYIDQDQLIKQSLEEALGLGPLEDLMADDDVDQIHVDRRDRIIVGRRGNLRGSGRAFSSDASFRRIVERLVSSAGATIDEGNPLVDLSLRDGSRLTAAVPPVAVRGACLTLRKPRRASHSLRELIENNTLSPAMGDFLETCVAARRNVLVCGAPGAGKSAIMSALAVAAPEGERVVTVEEVAELEIGRDNWIALESRPGDSNGIRTVDIATLLRSALRMRPDRLVVGDVRGVEALELVQAMASSADGTLASITGESAGASLTRLTSMARLAAPGLSDQGLRELVACAVDVVVQVASYADGKVRIASIAEVVEANELGYRTRELFAFRGGADGGDFQALGEVPAFYAELEARGIPADTSIFR